METPVVHILIDNDGIPRTINRRVKVKMIVQKHIFAKETLEDIAEHYNIGLSDVYAALAYYYDNKDEMDKAFAEAEALLKEVGVSSAELKSKIIKRMQEKQDSE